VGVPDKSWGIKAFNRRKAYQMIIGPCTDLNATGLVQLFIFGEVREILKQEGDLMA